MKKIMGESVRNAKLVPVVAPWLGTRFCASLQNIREQRLFGATCSSVCRRVGNRRVSGRDSVRHRWWLRVRLLIIRIVLCICRR